MRTKTSSCPSSRNQRKLGRICEATKATNSGRPTKPNTRNVRMRGWSAQGTAVRAELPVDRERAGAHAARPTGTSSRGLGRSRHRGVSRRGGGVSRGGRAPSLSWTLNCAGCSARSAFAPAPLSSLASSSSLALRSRASVVRRWSSARRASAVRRRIGVTPLNHPNSFKATVSEASGSVQASRQTR